MPSSARWAITILVISFTGLFLVATGLFLVAMSKLHDEAMKLDTDMVQQEEQAFKQGMVLGIAEVICQTLAYMQAPDKSPIPWMDISNERIDALYRARKHFTTSSPDCDAIQRVLTQETP